MSELGLRRMGRGSPLTFGRSRRSEGGGAGSRSGLGRRRKTSQEVFRCAGQSLTATPLGEYAG